MNGRKSLTAIRSTDQTFTIHPKTFVFFHKKTGTQRFEVKANADGSMPVNHVARLLAVHCVMRGQTPMDFGVVVTAGEDLLDGLGLRAEKLIQRLPDDPITGPADQTAGTGASRSPPKPVE